MEYLQANWIWLLLGLGVVWFLFRRGGMGCGMGGHESHGSHDSSESKNSQEPTHSQTSHNGHGRSEPEKREATTTTPRRRHGC